jgi:hypothetical protein
MTKYTVVGGTDIDELPNRLRPLVRLNTSPWYYASIYLNNTDAETLVPMPDDELVERDVRGDVIMLKSPVLMRPRHQLWALEPGVDPEYIPESAVHRRLWECAEKALVEAASAVVGDDIDGARERAGYAALACPDIPFITCAYIALWHSDLDESQLRWELAHLYDSSHDEIRESVGRIGRRPGMAPLHVLITNCPALDRIMVAP